MTNEKKNKIISICKEGVCPICAGTLSYSGDEDDYNGGGTYPWTCEQCGATGEEGYTKVFDGEHYNVQDPERNNVEIVAPSKVKKNDYVIIGHPINGNPDNGLEYLMDNEDAVMVFEGEDEAKACLRKRGFTDEEFDAGAVMFIHSIGHCFRCGSPLFPSQIKGYTSQCFTCDEDFYGIEQETKNKECDTPCWFEEICDALPKDPGSGKFWSTGEEILCHDKVSADTAAAFLNALGLEVAIGYYDPIEDKAAGLEDELTGCFYINLN